MDTMEMDNTCMHRSWRYAPPPPSLSPVVPLPPLLSLGCHFVARCRVRNEPVVPPAPRAARTARALRTRRLYASACHPAGASVLASGARVASSPLARLACPAAFGRCSWLSSPPGRACRRDFAAAGRARDHCRPFSDAVDGRARHPGGHTAGILLLQVELSNRAGIPPGRARHPGGRTAGILLLRVELITRAGIPPGFACRIVAGHRGSRGSNVDPSKRHCRRRWHCGALLV